MGHQREPIKNTCPDIDKYIKWIKMSIVDDRDLQRMDEKDLLETVSSMSSQLFECIGYLEELRSSNSTLREWGISESERVDELESQLKEEVY